MTILISSFGFAPQVLKVLLEIHVNYEQQTEYPLERIEKPGADWRVEKMKLSKDKRSLIYNDFLTLSGIPPEVFEYRLGNRSALEWIIDQYQVRTDKRSFTFVNPMNENCWSSDVGNYHSAAYNKTRNLEAHFCWVAYPWCD